ncbi:MAG TPA: TetR/AcrR family transcriptional regulator [Devosia sp.]|jgi:AcrR family transcriptional regulator|uniref:TetR/AcrR family transcriptional regulator n=1 Tax=Devosia sp. TaxID=1871048 RepID=UPI002F92E871
MTKHPGLDDLPQRRESGEDRRVAIAGAARAIIVEKGLEGLRTRDIAARVGINIATLHYHVPTKEALIALVAASLRDDFKSQALRHPKAGLAAAAQLREEFKEFREMVAEMPQVIGVLSELVDRARRDTTIADIILPMQAFWTQQYTEIFRLGITDGSFRKSIDPAAAAVITTAALTDCWRPHRRDQLDSVIAELERAFAPISDSSQG